MSSKTIVPIETMEDCWIARVATSTHSPPPVVSTSGHQYNYSNLWAGHYWLSYQQYVGVLNSYAVVSVLKRRSVRWVDLQLGRRFKY